ncbi:MAG TPA: VOC family protein [Usitatibacter sp.]|nr:VOC family protein [Usitatibacter sp.]
MPKALPIPKGFTAVTPYLICEGAAEAIDFYKRAFGAEEIMRMPRPDGKVGHAEIRINGSIIMLGEADPGRGYTGPKALKGSPVSIMLYVDDVDAMASRAQKAGAKVTQPVADMFWGDRYGTLDDPFGHHWAVATHVRDVSEQEMAEAMRKMSQQPHPA